MSQCECVVINRRYLNARYDNRRYDMRTFVLQIRLHAMTFK